MKQIYLVTLNFADEDRAACGAHLVVAESEAMAKRLMR